MARQHVFQVLTVHPSMSPKGVEHRFAYVLGWKREDVHPSMSPKGVEHANWRCSRPAPRKCIHQCRRKALSTHPTGRQLGWATGVHPSMSPKGVEHEGATGQALNLVIVHPSMSPKGVEHAVSSLVSPGQPCASINVAERR